MSVLGWGVAALGMWAGASGLVVLGWIAVIEIKAHHEGKAQR